MWEIAKVDPNKIQRLFEAEMETERGRIEGYWTMGPQPSQK